MTGSSATNKKNILSALFLGLLIFMMAALSAYASDEDEDDVFSVKVSAADTGDAEEVYISLSNDGGDFGGYVRLLISNSNYSCGGCYAYDSWVSVAAGETANLTIRVPISPGINMEEFDATVQVLDKREKLLFSEKQRQLFTATAAQQYAVLSNSGNKLNYLKNAFDYSYGYGNSMGSFSSVALMPSEILDGTLYQCSVLFIDDYDISKLSSEELEAIENWTRRGGILVIGTGTAQDLTFSSFSDDFIGCGLAGGKLKREYSYFSMDGYLTMADLDLSSAYLAVAVTNQEIHQKRIGTGGIIMCSFALSDDDLDGDYLGDVLVNQIYSLRNSSGNGSNSRAMSHYEMEHGYGILQGSSGFSATALRLLIILYIFLVGPGIYLILNKLKAREKIWIAVPALSLVFVFLVYLCSRGFSVQGRHFTTIRVAPSDGGVETDYVFGYSAKRKTWSVTLKDDALGSGPMMSQNYYYHSGDTDEYSYRTANTPDGTLLCYVPDSNFDEGYFKLISEDKEKDKGLSVELSLDHSIISGYVDNATEYDFDYMLVVCNGYCQLLRDVGAGENKKIDSLSRTQYSDWHRVMEFAERAYNSEDYEEAKYYEALCLAAYTLMDESSFVVGVSRGDKLLEGNNAEESFLCIYQTE